MHENKDKSDQTIGKLGKWFLQLVIQKQNCIILNLGHHRDFWER